MVVVVMGVSGAGKTTLGARLAERLGFDFAEGDDHHPPANLAKMRAGEPLDDADREPWLAALAGAIDAWTAAGRDVVLACSALKRAYRERLCGGREDVRLVYLDAPEPLLRERVAARAGHFFPPGLLESQLATLEPPGEDEAPIRVEVGAPPDALLERVAERLRGGVAPHRR